MVIRLPSYMRMARPSKELVAVFLNGLSPHKWLATPHKRGRQFWHILELFSVPPASANKGGVGVHKVLKDL